MAEIAVQEHSIENLRECEFVPPKVGAVNLIHGKLALEDTDQQS